MANLSQEQRKAFQDQITDKLTALLKADTAAMVDVSSVADGAGGVAMTIRVPKGATQLTSQVRDLAALIAERHS